MIDKTDRRIVNLMRYADANGDYALTVICRAAIRGDAECLAEVASLIEPTAAQLTNLDGSNLP